MAKMICNSLESFIAQQVQDGYNWQHVPKNTSRKHRSDGQSHPYPHGDGTS